MEVGLYAGQEDLPIDELPLFELLDLDDIDEAAELILDLLELDGVRFHDDRHAGDRWVLRRADGERVDVEGPRADQAGDARQHAEMVLNKTGNGVFFVHDRRV